MHDAPHSQRVDVIHSCFVESFNKGDSQRNITLASTYKLFSKPKLKRL
jgi:hypothetical protein